MRVKLLVAVMSLLLALGLSAPASAGWQEDPCGDAYLEGKDIYKAMVEMFPDPDFPNEEPWIYLCLKMCPGSGLPGVIVWEFDVDHNENTGGSKSMTGIPLPPCPCKTCKGYDIVIMKALREQGPDSALAWCRGCYGTGAAQCATRGPATTCTEGTCYELDQTCYAGGDCYELTEECTDCAGANPPYYPLNTPCPSIYCGLPAKAGKWQASIMEAGPGGALADWGRDIPIPPEPCNPDKPKYCEKLPWGQIVRAALALDMPYDAAPDFWITTPPLWQVSTYFDPVFADQDDYVTGFSLDITDLLLNGNCNKAPGQLGTGDICHKYQKLFHCCLDQMACENNEDYDECSAYTDQGTCEGAGCYWNADKSACQLSICMSDSSFDGKITGSDLGVLKKEYGRRDCACY